MAEVQLSEAAASDLDALAEWSIQHHGVAAARRYLRRLSRAMRQIADFPASGTDASRFAEALRALPVGEHVVFYRDDGASVLVVRVLHGRQDIAAILGADDDPGVREPRLRWTA